MNSRISNLHTEILVGAIVVLLTVHFSLAWTTPVNISNTSGRSKIPSLAVDGWGNVHVVWMDNTSGNNEILYCLNNGECWSAPQNISNDPTDSEEPDITIDVAGHPHVAWIDHQSKEILWTFFDGIFWSSPANISNNPGYSTCPSLAADDSGKVFIVWHDIQVQSDIYLSIYDGTSWSTPKNLTDDPVDSSDPDIGVDSRDHVHLVWMDYGDLDIHYSSYAGDSLTEPLNISQLTGQSCGPQIALDSQGHPHVVWEERWGGYYGYYTFYNGSSWHESIKISEFEPLRVPEIAIDARDVVYTVWTTAGEVGGETYWNFYTGDSWSIPVNLSNTPDEASGSPDIGIDELDNLHVVFVEWDNDNWEIFYTRRSSTRVEEQPGRSFPQRHRLEQNYPNPFNARTCIEYELPRAAQVSLKIYNILGQQIKTLANDFHHAGHYKIFWDGRNSMGSEVASGIYFVRLEGGTHALTRKMVLLR